MTQSKNDTAVIIASGITKGAAVIARMYFGKNLPESASDSEKRMKSYRWFFNL